MKIGDYESNIHEKGNKSFLKTIRTGELYWTVQIDNDGQMDIKTQTEAEIISRLIRNKQTLDTIQNMVFCILILIIIIMFMSLKWMVK